MAFRSEYIYTWYTVCNSYVKLFFRNGKILLMPIRFWVQFKNKILVSKYEDIRRNYITFLVKD